MVSACATPSTIVVSSFDRSGPITSMYERERRLQTDLSWPTDFIPRGLAGLEGLLMSSATGQISEGDRRHAPKREPSIVTFDPQETHSFINLNVRNATYC
jgi:hypothetical protein